ncbi:MAG TPA: heterodisulfide reductase-related iron-sulfur binding cluster [Candidatus Competibacteraceae bacterium]|nr:heterodisulfide reductase-related iron-sulfur binding cluster [Candidatus Competibacteraceae bacterium]
MAEREMPREGSLEAPTRHPIDWQSPDFFDEAKLFQELERIFDICHGCRRCFSLCNAFPTLFDLIDATEDMELHGVAKGDYWKVVDHCYLCDMCYMTKCPYVPPHPWNVDFPHLMLRAKAVKFRQGRVGLRDKLITSTDLTGKLAGIPVVSETVNAVNRNPRARRLLHKHFGIHAEARLPPYAPKTLKQRLAGHRFTQNVVPGGPTRGRVALFGTCYGSYNEPQLGEDLLAVFEHNGIPVTLVEDSRCCGMPKLELGDLESVARLKEHNLPRLATLVEQGWDIVAPVPSCVLMLKSELPLLFPDDPLVRKVAEAVYDPFEYLMLRHKAGLLKTDFKSGLGKVAYHLACHLRVQNIGQKTREVLELVPGTQVMAIERCAGHDGTYGVRAETHEIAMKIGKPVVGRIQSAKADHYASDCPIAGHHLENGLKSGQAPTHPLTLLRRAYGI